MRKLVLILFIFGFSLLNFSQDNHGTYKKELPHVNIKDTKGKVVNTAEIQNDGKPIVISFWATWCSPCKRELNAIADLYEDWQTETGVKLYAISIDDTRTSNSVKPYVNSKGWEYTVLMDSNGDFKKAMGVNNVPHTFIVMNGKIVYSHNSYAPGDENTLYNKLLELTKNNDE